ncbi:RNA polymerase sigma-70 factor (ECF subfamily) [Paenibacillus endophyticus]|uniref:RNA polymerase sigma-70 factor (ECF subfamily) n=1 Tax=Paenibacillus endophyticus TaxID=1294268 RepID=A0A7W5C6E3_9BACL|nr:RNA polymerase sigma factor [Paenibacillus endophyticus]MBB3151529.1 RNA polymerase sigma-70 factor (ECF subfamily) [Paenibacillus endophyticus]
MKVADGSPTIEVNEQKSILEALYTTLHRYCLSLTKSSWDADDLVQETWLRGMPTLLNATHANPEAFLLRIAKNVWTDQWRRNHSYRMTIERIINSDAIKDQYLTDCEVPLYALIRHLSPIQRKVFLLREVFHYSIAETAEMLSTTDGAVKAALFRARDALTAARAELESGKISLPKEEEWTQWLRVMTIAYHAGDIALLIELVQRDIAEAPLLMGKTTRNKTARQKPQPQYLKSSFMSYAA